ncbi:hypothetical protein PYCC9005_001901 [Savitreella phatthalungensis]
MQAFPSDFPVLNTAWNMRDRLVGIYSSLDIGDVAWLLRLRELSAVGDPSTLISRLADSDLSLFDCRSRIDADRDNCVRTSVKLGLRGAVSVQLPSETWAEILRRTRDWELATALGYSDIALPMPIVWEGASKAHLAILRDDQKLISTLSAGELHPLPSHVVEVVIRFEYLDTLALLNRLRPASLKADTIPLLASRFNSPAVLEWWKLNFSQRIYDESCLEAASASGNLDALEWWRSSGLPLRIGRVLDFASDEGHVEVLDWWKSSGLKYKYTKFAMHHASQNGHVNVLNWWLESGLQLFYDRGCLDLATRFNQVAVLEWWRTCGLVIEYRIMDIEEALGEALVAGNDCRNWWIEQGIDFGADNNDWLRDRTLNEHAEYRAN